MITATCSIAGRLIDVPDRYARGNRHCHRNPHARADSDASPSPPSSGTETTLTSQQGKNGYAGCEDTYIYQYAPTTNYCGHNLQRVGYKQQCAALLYFDLAPLPAHATATQATL